MERLVGVQRARGAHDGHASRRVVRLAVAALLIAPALGGCTAQAAAGPPPDSVGALTRADLGDGDWQGPAPDNSSWDAPRMWCLGLIALFEQDGDAAAAAHATYTEDDTTVWSVAFRYPAGSAALDRRAALARDNPTCNDFTPNDDRGTGMNDFLLDDGPDQVTTVEHGHENGAAYTVETAMHQGPDTVVAVAVRYPTGSAPDVTAEGLLYDAGTQAANLAGG
ncbi:hypothetical protein ACPPVS_05945 [Cellulomonas sp. McL0617]|uniref:hypothetical protein n=1 Tax=Cellulomonas sp. McL0617 TaxID=3415675 RepID=UPI003CEB844B